ncbi:MAG: ATP-binding protein [bacterium]
MIIKRALEEKLKALASQFAAVSVTGPRQSGKTTLVKQAFPNYEYFNFEDPNTRSVFRADPHNFLKKFMAAPGLILDEPQNVPEIFSYLQIYIDEYHKPGHFIITGSQNFLLNESISQSLAGRIAILNLLPLSLDELQQAKLLPSTIDDTLFKGFYPELYKKEISIVDWYGSYINTYLERDVRLLKNVTSLDRFSYFMKLCAGRNGQVLNLSSISDDLGISVTAINQWLSVLQSCYIIFLLEPYYKNFGKRVVKSPKIFFYDPGIVCSLLNLTSSDQLFANYMRGNIFEAMIISDFFKQQFNRGMRSSCYYWRDKSDFEIDCVVERAGNITPVEIKVSKTADITALGRLSSWNELTETKPIDNVLVYGGDDNWDMDKGHIVSWKSAGNLIETLDKRKG